MAELETEYRGYRITYGRNSDKWSCGVLNMEADTLTALENKIGRYLAKIAKVAAAIPAITIPSNAFSSSQFEECFVISVASNRKVGLESKSVWTYKERQEGWRGNTRTVKDRSKLSADGLALDTPENRILIDKAKAAEREVAAARKRYDEALKAIPRIDISTLKEEDDE